MTVRGPSWDRVRGWPVPEGRLDKAHVVRGIHALTSVDPLPLCTEEFPFVIICEHKQVIQCITLFALLLCPVPLVVLPVAGAPGGRHGRVLGLCARTCNADPTPLVLCMANRP